MTGSVGLVVVLLVVAAALTWIFVGPGRSRHREPPRAAGDGSVDAEELAAAEEEVRDVDALASPEDAAEELPDWGPGAPRP
ncbi:MAG: hypothetical protein JSW43_11830 [Gemmatimonadota bacterium]|nr:MAG: hypothetical protein JSW43_11830 [Gemmatimonadota bacterium]